MRADERQQRGLDLKAHIRTVPDFPVPGIRFRDITPLLASPEAYGDVIRRLADTYRDGRVGRCGQCRGQGVPVRRAPGPGTGGPFCAGSKPGKLPHETRSHSYQLEYGEDTLEVHTDAVKPRGPGADGR
ncbi:MAG: hypothetical protein Ct9H300mP1_00540 [Planctomycetaceae bacterium]|nr:MAG: hypothetical protein Ct9H300mP1_00540 [Planctomycetaceae bacterium]